MPRPKRMPVSKGRPTITIDWDKVEMWLQAGCTGIEIAARIGIHADTLYDRTITEKGVCFSDYAARGHQSGNSMIRSRQFQSAMQNNTRMLEILGKERLGQGKSNESVAPNDSGLAMIQDLIKKNKELEEQLNALRSQTDPVLPASNEEIQYMGGCGSERQDVCIDPQADGSN